MKPTGVNMTNVKLINRANVLQLLLANGAMSRTDLAAVLHLTTATLSTICSDFIQRGILVESSQPDVSASIGRKKYPLDINRTFKYVVAISIHYTGSVIAITDLRGSAIAKEILEGSFDDALAYFRHAATHCIGMLWKHGIQPDAVLGAGVCIVGSVDHINGTSLNPFRIFQEQQVPIKELLEKELPFPVCVENNVCAFLTAENLFEGSHSANVMVVKWGPGVGSASSIDGVIYKSSSFNSMEIGHTYFYPDSKKTCRCGLHGCLETGVDLSCFIEQILRLVPASPVLESLVKEIGQPDIHNILEFLNADCHDLQDFSMHCARDLAIGVNNAIHVFSPDKVILYGSLFESPILVHTFLETIHKINPMLPKDCFHHSRLADSKEYIGPAAIAIKNFLVETGGE